jgi:3'(2'), 5'-bisphosphate nucleotidase
VINRTGNQPRIAVTPDSMTPPIDRRLLDELASIISRAGAAILREAAGGLAHRDKPDGSPVTAADEASQAVILEGLGRLLPGVPVISEEAPRSADALGNRFLLVDPLDGTHELLAGETEYAVNIALIDNGQPVAGVIAAPALGTIWMGIAGLGAELLTLAPGEPAASARTRNAIRSRARPQQGAVALISRFHRDTATDAYLDRIPQVQRTVCGSSIKFCRIAEGSADLYARMTSLSEWDAAAGHALVIAAGGTMTALDGAALPYGRASFRLPPFIASGDRAALA